MPNYDKIFYINIIQDLAQARATELFLRGIPTIFINIPLGHLTTFGDPQLAQVTNHSKIDFNAHGTKIADDYVFDRRTEDATFYSLDEVAAFFNRFLNKPMFKDPNATSRLTLACSICEGLNFARNLQRKLHEDYEIYVDVVANNYIITSQYGYGNPERTKVYIMSRTTSLTRDAPGEHKRPHSKVLLFLDKDERQKEIDAYEFRWIGSVLNMLQKQQVNFEHRTQLSGRKNRIIWKAMGRLITDICQLVGTDIKNSDTNKIANEILARLKRYVSLKGCELRLLSSSKNMTEEFEQNIREQKEISVSKEADDTYRVFFRTELPNIVSRVIDAHHFPALIDLFKRIEFTNKLCSISDVKQLLYELVITSHDESLTVSHGRISLGGDETERYYPALMDVALKLTIHDLIQKGEKYIALNPEMRMHLQFRQQLEQADEAQREQKYSVGLYKAKKAEYSERLNEIAEGASSDASESELSECREEIERAKGLIKK